MCIFDVWGYFLNYRLKYFEVYWAYYWETSVQRYHLYASSVVDIYIYTYIYIYTFIGRDGGLSILSNLLFCLSSEGAKNVSWPWLGYLRSKIGFFWLWHLLVNLWTNIIIIILSGVIFLSNVQNICNLIGREEYSIGLIALSIWKFYSSAKGQQHSNSAAQKIGVY